MKNIIFGISVILLSAFATGCYNSGGCCGNSNAVVDYSYVDTSYMGGDCCCNSRFW